MGKNGRTFYWAAVVVLLATTILAAAPRVPVHSKHSHGVMAIGQSLEWPGEQLGDETLAVLGRKGFSTPTFGAPQRNRSICDPGLGPILQVIMAVPYAIAYLIVFVAGIIFMILLLAGSLVLIIFYGLAAGLLYMTGQSTKQAEPLYNWSKASFENADYVFGLSGDLNIWYSGNCD